MKYIESKPNGDGTFDHTEVMDAYTGNSKIFYKGGHQSEYKLIPVPFWLYNLQYMVEVPDTYGIHESASTLREVKGDAGPAVAEMLLDRIKELEEVIEYKPEDYIKRGSLDLPREYYLEKWCQAVSPGDKLSSLIQDKFKSGNAIPVERITLTRAEVNEVFPGLLK